MQPHVSLPGNKWEFTSTVEEAKIIPIDYYHYISWNESNDEMYKTRSNDAIFLVWYFEGFVFNYDPIELRMLAAKNIFAKMYDKVLYVHSNPLDNVDPNFIYYDLFFNREKLYLTDYNHELCWKTQFTFTSPPCTFALDSLEKTFSPSNKIFLIPNRIRTTTSIPMRLKKKLKDFVNSNISSMYFSEPVTGNFLSPNGWDTLPPEEIAHLTPILKNNGWAPIDNKYYKTSYVTVCVENNTQGFVPNNFMVTEKYLDPLIKGNFPLVYAAPFTISNLKKIYGFKFPDWIDYSYDNIIDDNKRWESYLNSIKQVNQFSLEEIHNFYLSNLELLQHNRNIFYSRPYDIIYDKVKKSIEQLGW